MHVLCPSCAAEYEIPPLQRPRKLRCARCAAEWRVEPAPDPEPEAASDGQADAGFDEPGCPAEPVSAMPGISLSPMVPQADWRASGLALRRLALPDVLLWPVLWVLSGLVVAAAVFGFWHWRGPIGHGWPPSLRLYRLLPGGA